MGDYYIDDHAPNHIEEALKFANRNGIQVVIKNSGHDYLGRGTAPHALVLPTHNYHPPITLTNNFVPAGCRDPVGKVVTFGAGQQWGVSYEFAETNNVTVVGGPSATVGAAGGWILGGGYGMLTPAFGLGVDNVQQFRVVLPDGISVTANRCQNADIFSALRGGGGGTFGVIIEMSTTAHQQLMLHYAKVQLFGLNPTQMREFLKILVVNANRWSAEGWGGDSYPISKRSIQFVNPQLDANVAVASLKPLIDFANSLPKKGSVLMKTYPSWYKLYAENMASSYSSAASWGTAMPSRLIPSSTFQWAQNQDRLVDAILASSASNTGMPSVIPTICMNMPARIADSGSALTASWRQTTWSYMLITQWNPALATAAQIRTAFGAVHTAMGPLRKLTPSTGVFLNEADVLEIDSPTLYLGTENDQKLLKIKKLIDPNNVLQVHGGVGWNSTAQIFHCYPKAGNAAVGSLGEL